MTKKEKLVGRSIYDYNLQSTPVQKPTTSGRQLDVLTLPPYRGFWIRYALLLQEDSVTSPNTTAFLLQMKRVPGAKNFKGKHEYKDVQMALQSANLSVEINMIQTFKQKKNIRRNRMKHPQVRDVFFH